MKFLSILFNCDILNIIRPVIYLYFVMKKGRNSWVPIYVSAAMDLLIIFLIEVKLYRSDKLRSIERRDLAQLIKSIIVKYLLRDPIFETFTLPFLQRVFKIFRIPQWLFGIVLSILNYYKYYTYIA